MKRSLLSALMPILTQHDIDSYKLLKQDRYLVGHMIANYYYYLGRVPHIPQIGRFNQKTDKKDAIHRQTS